MARTVKEVSVAACDYCGNETFSLQVCARCGRDACFEHYAEYERTSPHSSTAFLVDGTVVFERFIWLCRDTCAPRK